MVIIFKTKVVALHSSGKVVNQMNKGRREVCRTNEPNVSFERINVLCGICNRLKARRLRIAGSKYATLINGMKDDYNI